MLLQTKLELRQSQSLIITPQLQQAIKLLQLSNLELQSFLEREIEQNPLIDWESQLGSSMGTADDAAPGTEPFSQETPASADNAASEPSGTSPSSDGSQDGFDAADFPEAAPASFEALSLRSPGGGAANGSGGRIEDYTAEQTTLHDHLRQQLHMAVTDPVKRLIGDHLIDLIDEAGYLRGELQDIAERLGAPADLVEGVLTVIQGFEPSGIGARSLAECLAIQLKERNRFDPAMDALLCHLDLLASRDFGKLKRVCGVDHEDLIEMIAEIKALNPKPGLMFGSPRIEAVVPDIIIERDAEQGWKVQINNETLPRISVNRDFYSAARRMARSDKDKHYLQNCMSTANWLARSLDQRRRTMLTVAREIVRQQAAFFEIGVRGLRPLGLKDVADRIGMHESTVSRVTSNKYLQTPRGTFELKYFFTSAIAAAGMGDAHSSEAVKYRIKELIDGEAPRAILSDDKIVAMLRDDGIDIARRTVAKYREIMRIPSSVQRRREKSSASTHALLETRG
ncbi:MAG: RNA polymerase factor sigma-54 [Rhodomicrobium sp.]|nr:RNA polymerase factor sigma-54 [Rhodomicrobium sp.]